MEGGLVFGVLAITASHLHHTHTISLTLAGGTTALFGFGGMLYMATAKYTIRRFGEVSLARYGGSLLSVCFGVVAFTPWWPLAIPACFLAGFGFAMFHNTMQAKATQMVPSARGTSVTLFAGALFLGQSLGVLVLAKLMTYTDSAHVIGIDAAGVAGLAWYFGQKLKHRNASQADHA
jgi:MFS family permease